MPRSPCRTSAPSFRCQRRHHLCRRCLYQGRWTRHRPVPGERCGHGGGTHPEGLHEDRRGHAEGDCRVALDIDHLFGEHHRKWKRRPKRPENPTVRTDVTFEETQRYTIIDVYAFDRVGFLYRVTETMSLLGLNITFAKIATRVDGIVDALLRAGSRWEGRRRSRAEGRDPENDSSHHHRHGRTGADRRTMSHRMEDRKP